MASTSSNLKYDPACVEVNNFAQLAAKHPDYPFPADGRGPFAIWQEGVAPGDMSFTVAEFYLTREGTSPRRLSPGFKPFRLTPWLFPASVNSAA